MKLAVVIGHFKSGVGGAENIALAVVSALVRQGHEVLVCASTGTPVEGVELRLLPLSEAPGVAKAWGAEAVLDWGLNVPASVHRLGGGVHRQFLELALMASPAWLRPFKRLEYRWAPRHRRTIAREREICLASGTRFIAVSEFVARHLAEFLAPDLPAVEVIRNGVDTVRFSLANRALHRQAVRNRLGLEPGEVAALFVGHNLGLKNFALLERILPRLAAGGRRLRLVVAGKRHPGVAAPWCRYAGTEIPMEQLYAGADLLLHPTYYDACANVVIEAMAAGLPVLSSDRNGSAEFINDGVSGRVLPVAGQSSGAIEDAWLEALRPLVDDADARDRMGTVAAASQEGNTLEAYAGRVAAVLARR